MSANPYARLDAALCGLLILGIAAYAGVRAWTLSFTHDEALSYMAWANAPWGLALSWEGIGSSPNSHFLNTLLLKTGSALFGPREAALRLSGLLGGGLFLLAAYGLTRQLTSPGRRFFGLALLTANPYLLDFFSLARGYGLALGFTTLALWFVVLRLRQPQGPGLGLNLAANLAAALAALSNLACLNVFLALVAVLVGYELFGPPRRQHGPIKRLARAFVAPAPAALLLAWVYWVPVRMLQQADQFFFGGERGFFADTVASLLKGALYLDVGHSADLSALAMALAVAGLILPVLLARTLRRSHPSLPLAVVPAFWLFALPALCALGSITQHVILDTRFVIDRAASYYYPLVSVFVLALLAAWREYGPSGARRAATAATVVLAGVALLNLALHANLQTTREWPYDACTKPLITTLSRELSAPGRAFRPVRLGTDHLHAPAVVFYLHQLNLRQVDWDYSEPGIPFDYYLLPRSALPGAAGGHPPRLMETCPTLDTVLAARD